MTFLQSTVNYFLLAFLCSCLGCQTKGDHRLSAIASSGIVLPPRGEKAVFIVPVNGCSPCIDNTLAYLNDIDPKKLKDFDVLLVSNGLEKALRLKMKEYPKIDFYTDANGAIQDQLGYAQSPVLIKINDGQVTDQQLLTDNNYEQMIADYLRY